MSSSNRPPSRRDQHQQHAPQQQVFMDGPNGGIELSNFDVLDAVVEPMKMDNVSLQQVAAFQDCAKGDVWTWRKLW